MTESPDKSNNVNRRRFLTAVGAGATGVAVAGCLGDEVDEDAITIGSLAPDPATNPVGMSIRGGVELGVRELNENGGLLGEEVAHINRDTEGRAGRARSAYHDLVIDRNVDVTMGTFVSEALLGIIDEIADEQTLHITSGSGTPEVSDLVHEEYDRYKYHFRVGPFNSIHLGRSLVDFADLFFDEYGWERVAVLIEEAEWTAPLAEVVEAELPELGFEVTSIQEYSLDTGDFSPIYDDLEGDDIDLAYTAIAHTGEAAVTQWFSQERSFEFGGILVPAQFPIIWAALDGAVEYSFTQTTATPTSEITPLTVPFTERFVDAFDNEPVYTGHISYDAVMLYAAYVEEAGTTDPEELIPMMANNEVEVMGTTSRELEFYGPDSPHAHDSVYDKESWTAGEGSPVWLQWQDGEQVTFAADPVADGDYQSPPWLA